MAGNYRGASATGNRRGPGWVTLPSVPYEGPYPAPPEGLTDIAVAEWDSWFASPMAWAWLPCDWSGLATIIRLKDRSIRGEPAAVKASYLSQIRLWEDAFGLTRKGRQYIKWRFAEDGAHVGAERFSVVQEMRERSHGS